MAAAPSAAGEAPETVDASASLMASLLTSVAGNAPLNAVASVVLPAPGRPLTSTKRWTMRKIFACLSIPDRLRYGTQPLVHKGSHGVTATASVRRAAGSNRCVRDRP